LQEQFDIFVRVMLSMRIMAKAYKQIRLTKVPVHVHKKLKVQAAECGKTLEQRIIDILTTRMEKE
jgi:hypothetical protein